MRHTARDRKTGGTDAFKDFWTSTMKAIRVTPVIHFSRYFKGEKII
jgi:hypothetical protein